MVSFTPRPLYPRGKSSRYILDRRLGGLQNRSERLGEEEVLDFTGTRTPIFQRNILPPSSGSKLETVLSSKASVDSPMES
jgi:hypothetical protein